MLSLGPPAHPVSTTAVSATALAARRYPRARSRLKRGMVTFLGVAGATARGDSRTTGLMERLSGFDMSPPEGG
ncbi:hypothetical protein FMUBM48_16240 [Nocardia cyriacigeorgica]|nr:hypothetical protein FMUBM48_16240 [Nocardia cyriacigeorgica]